MGPVIIFRPEPSDVSGGSAKNIFKKKTNETNVEILATNFVASLPPNGNRLQDHKLCQKGEEHYVIRGGK